MGKLKTIKSKQESKCSQSWQIIIVSTVEQNLQVLQALQLHHVTGTQAELIRAGIHYTKEMKKRNTRVSFVEQRLHRLQV